MNRDNRIIFDSPEGLAEGFAGIFYKKVDELLKTNAELNIALSGGNTPKEFFKILASDYKDRIEWNRINFYWVDERCVPPDSPESNFGNAYNTLFKIINVSPARLHRIKGEVPAVTEAERYSDLVKYNIPHEDTLPCFDLILLGIGEDGHTASIFPNQMNLLTTAKLYDVAYHPVSSQPRITMSGILINNAKNIYFLVSGVNKSVVVNDILSGNERAKHYPANYIVPVNGELYWVVENSSLK